MRAPTDPSCRPSSRTPTARAASSCSRATRCASIVERDGVFTVSARSGQVIEAAGVVAGLGIEPPSRSRQQPASQPRDGILVDERLRTTDPDVFAAGDVANVSRPPLGGRVRVEHEDAAVTMGHAAGRAMAGDESPTAPALLLLGPLRHGVRGGRALDARLETGPDWKEPFREGVVYYLARAACAACCCGTSGDRSKPPASSCADPARSARRSSAVASDDRASIAVMGPTG